MVGGLFYLLFTPYTYLFTQLLYYSTSLPCKYIPDLKHNFKPFFNILMMLSLIILLSDFVLLRFYK